MNPDPLILHDSLAEAFVPFIRYGGFEKIDKWLRDPGYEDQRAALFCPAVDDLGPRLSFFFHWRAKYCPWLISRLQGIAPELVRVVGKYDGLWETWANDGMGPHTAIGGRPDNCTINGHYYGPRDADTGHCTVNWPIRTLHISVERLNAYSMIPDHCGDLALAVLSSATG